MHRQRYCLQGCIGMLIWIATGTPLAAQPDLSRTIVCTVAGRRSASYDFSDVRLDSADAQRHYRVRIAIPKGAPPAAGHPVVYLLDAMRR